MFKTLKDWIFFTGSNRGRKREGILCATSEGRATVTVRWYPNVVNVFFDDPAPPIDPCHPHPPDTCSYTLSYIGFGRWGVIITWSVWSVRQIKYDIEGTM